MGSENLIVDTATRIFGDFCDPQTVNRAKDEVWRRRLGAALEEAGLTLTWVPDGLGGAGAELADGFAVLRRGGPLCRGRAAGRDTPRRLAAG